MTTNDVITSRFAPFPSPLAMMARPPLPTLSIVAVVGLGDLGLRIAIAAAAAGTTVIGIDPDPGRIEALRSASSPVGTISDDSIASMPSAQFSCDVRLVRAADVVVIANAEPSDLALLRSVLSHIPRTLPHERVVVADAEPYPGRAEALVRPILERLGMRVGEDVRLVFAIAEPEDA